MRLLITIKPQTCLRLFRISTLAEAILFDTSFVNGNLVFKKELFLTDIKGKILRFEKI